MDNFKFSFLFRGQLESLSLDKIFLPLFKMLSCNEVSLLKCSAEIIFSVQCCCMFLQVLKYFDESVGGLYKNDCSQLSLKRPPSMQEKRLHKGEGCLKEKLTQ